MREYELYLVLDADAEEDAVNSIVERVTQLVNTGDGETQGEVVKVESRGKRRLAYTVRKKTEGHDVLFTFKAPAAVLPEIERILKLDELVLRHLLVRTDEK
jgi:small subunit ribosomal protein S6